MVRPGTQSFRTKDKSSCLAILDRVLSEQAPTWTTQEAEAIIQLVLVESEANAPTPESGEGMAEQFGMCLELLKCRARMQLRSANSR